MWWSSRLVLALAAVALLGACGFRPLHGERTSPGVQAELARVAVAPVEDRIGQLLRNELVDRLRRRGEAAEPGYGLQVTLTSTVGGTAFRRDATSTRQILTVTADYVLRQGESVLLARQSVSTTGFDELEAHVASVAGARDAERRAAQVLSEEIMTQLALYFARRQAGAAE